MFLCVGIFHVGRIVVAVFRIHTQQTIRCKLNVLKASCSLCEFYIWRPAFASFTYGVCNWFCNIMIRYKLRIQFWRQASTGGCSLLVIVCWTDWIDADWLPYHFLIWNLQALNALSAHTNYLMCCKRKLERTSRCPSFQVTLLQTCITHVTAPTKKIQPYSFSKAS